MFREPPFLLCLVFRVQFNFGPLFLNLAFIIIYLEITIYLMYLYYTQIYAKIALWDVMPYKIRER